jgi:glycosyltransferase involved in cell wall biosynthesis
MRIAYVTEWNPYDPSGVLRKIMGQVTAWTRAGVDVRVFAVAATRDTACALDFERHGEVVGRISQDSLDRYGFARLGYVNKVASAPALRRAVKTFNPDIIYYRQQGPWYPGLGAVLRLAPTVAELNGTAAGEAPWGWLNVAYRRATCRRWQRLVAGFVAVSPGIADEYRALDKPIAVVPNSMPTAPDPLPPTANEAPAFVFVGSALANDGAWHGVDKILDLAQALPASRFEIVGMTQADLGEPRMPPNLRFHGPKYGNDLEAIYRSCDVGIGTLALHRRNLEINSALKPLEYLTFGLPVVLGYREVEAALNDADYALHIGNHEKNVVQSIDAIADFAGRWCGQRVTSDLGYLSSDVIEGRRLEFLRSFVAQAT